MGQAEVEEREGYKKLCRGRVYCATDNNPTISYTVLPKQLIE